MSSFSIAFILTYVVVPVFLLVMLYRFVKAQQQMAVAQAAAAKAAEEQAKHLANIVTALQQKPYNSDANA